MREMERGRGREGRGGKERRRERKGERNGERTRERGRRILISRFLIFIVRLTEPAGVKLEVA